MGCATGIVKYFVFLANLVFALAGLALIVIGVLFKVEYKGTITDSLPAQFNYGAIFCIIIGAVVFITAFLGCCGAVKESTCMLTTYAIILLTIFIIQLIIGVYAFLQIKNTSDLQRLINDKLAKPFNEYNRNEEARSAVDVTQSVVKCCGLEGPDYWSRAGQNIPRSCCEHKSDTCGPASTDLYHEGCTRALYLVVEKSAKVIGGVVIGIALIEILGAVFALCLASSIRNHYRRNLYA